MRNLILGIFLLVSASCFGQLIPGVVASSGGTSSTILNGLYNWHKLDETSGNAIDSHDSFTGTSTNITYTASGKIGRCYTFNGTSSNVNLGNVIKPTTGISISLWIKTTAATTGYIIDCSGYEDTFWHGWRIRYGVSFVNFFAGDGAGHQIDWSYNATLNNGTWHYIVATWDGSNAYIYVDNTKSSGTAYAYTLAYVTAGHNLRYGCNNDATGNFYTGDLDMPGILNRALTDAEIAWIWNDGNGRDYPF